MHMFVGVCASLPQMEACWSEIDRQIGDRCRRTSASPSASETSLTQQQEEEEKSSLLSFKKHSVLCMKK